MLLVTSDNQGSDADDNAPECPFALVASTIFLPASVATTAPVMALPAQQWFSLIMAPGRGLAAPPPPSTGPPHHL